MNTKNNILIKNMKLFNAKSNEFAFNFKKRIIFQKI